MTPAVRRAANEALALVTEDGEWPSPSYEKAPEARRAAAMQEAIKKLAEAILALAEQS